MEKNVQLKYRMYRRRNGIFYWQENDSRKQATLRTSERREAERLLEGTGWLPEPLRLADADVASDAATSEVEALPGFLADDDEVQAETDEDQPHVVAAD